MNKAHKLKAIIHTILAVSMLIGANAMAQLPNPGLDIDPARTAVVITDPQNDCLSPEGAT